MRCESRAGIFVAMVAGVAVSAAIFVASANAQSGWGAAVSGDALYFTDLLRGRVWRMERDGTRTAVMQGIHCHNLAPGYDGVIYGEAVGEGSGGGGGTVSVWRIGRDGVVSHPLPATSAPNPSVWITYDAAGNGYAWRGEAGRVSEILKRTPDGNVFVLAGGAWGSEDGRGGDARFGQVGGLGVTRDGTVYVLDAGNLRRVRADGTTETLARGVADARTGGLPGGAFGLFNHSVGVAVTADETVYVVDHYGLKIVRWREGEGARTVVDSSNWISRMTDGSWGWAPTGVAIAGDEIYVVETLPLPGLVNDLVGTPRVRKIRANGEIEYVATVNDWRVRASAGVILAGFLALVAQLHRRKENHRMAGSPMT